jgi:hypothetical protein
MFCPFQIYSIVVRFISVAGVFRNELPLFGRLIGVPSVTLSTPLVRPLVGELRRLDKAAMLKPYLPIHAQEILQIRACWHMKINL